MGNENIFPPFSVIIPAYNEEKSIAKCIDSVLQQTIVPERVIIVNDGSNDLTQQIAELYKEIFPEKLVVVNLKKNTGNKALALRYAMPYLEGELVFYTDADSELEPNAFEYMIQHFLDPRIGGVSGYVRSRKHNVITGVRELQYIMGQELYKKGKESLSAVIVIPGPIGAVRRELFDPRADTVTEDMDLTLSIVEKGYSIAYDPRAIAWTSDPPNLKSYVRQMIRWFSGFFQNIRKHFIQLPRRVKSVMALTFTEYTIFSIILDISLIFGIISGNYLPFIVFGVSETLPWGLVSLYAAVKMKRKDLTKSVILMPLIRILDLHIWLYAFIKEMLFSRKESEWRRADRFDLKITKLVSSSLKSVAPP